MLYIGVLWGKTQVQEYGKVDNYIASVFFIPKFLLLPYILSLFLEEHLPKILESIGLKYTDIVYGIIIILEYILLKLIHKNNMKYESKYTLILYEKRKMVS